MAEDFKYIRFKVIRAGSLKYLFEQLDDEPRPFELVVHPSIAGARPITIKATNTEDAQYFNKLLRGLAYEPDKVKQ